MKFNDLVAKSKNFRDDEMRHFNFKYFASTISQGNFFSSVPEKNDGVEERRWMTEFLQENGGNTEWQKKWDGMEDDESSEVKVCREGIAKAWKFNEKQDDFPPAVPLSIIMSSHFIISQLIFIFPPFQSQQKVTEIHSRNLYKKAYQTVKELKELMYATASLNVSELKSRIWFYFMRKIVS